MQGLRQALRVILLSSAALIPGVAFATVWDVSPAGTGNASLSTANSSALPGDVIRLAPGSYSVAPNPTRNGSSSARITYIGNLATPSQVQVPGMNLTRRWVTIKGVRFTGNFGLERAGTDVNQYAQYDSVGWCEVANDLGVNQAKDNVVYRVDVTSGNGHFTMNAPAVPVADWTIPERNTIRRCNMSLGMQQTYGTHVFMMRGAQHCQIDSNTINITLSPNITAETDPMIAFYSKWNQFNDNHWHVHSMHNQGHLFRWRDSTSFNRVYRDTILLSGYEVTFEPSSAGSWPGTTDQNYFEGLYLRKSCVTSSAALFYQNGSRRDTLRNCVVIDSVGRPFQGSGYEKGASLIDHCTFAGNSKWGVARFECGVGSFGDPWPASGSLTFTNNIMYALRQGGGGSDAGANWTFSSSSNALTSNNNLYFVPGQGTTRAICWAVNGGGATYSAPGTGTPFYNAFGEDGSSKYGDPLFVDASYATFDGRLRSGSAAIAAGSGGSDIGALGFQGPDTSPPGTVSNLAFSSVFDQSAVITWTAPGDNGNSGTATAFDLRYSTAPITAANFTGATAVTPQPVPGLGGTPQSYVLNGLARGTRYYVAFRAVDDAGNWSVISNVPSAMTNGTDSTPPSPVTDLSTTP